MRFHRDIGFPRGCVLPTHKARLIYSRHAREQADARNIALRNMIDFDNVVIIEIGYDDRGNLDHYLARTVYSPTRDLSFALVPIGNKYLVKSVWLNDFDDIHKSLDHSAYATP